VSRVVVWQNIKIYVLAYVIMLTGALVSTGLQLVGDQFPIGHPISILAANLSGMTIGGLFMVMGFIRDGRIDKERKRADAAQARAETAEAKVQTAEARAEAAEAKVEQERERTAAAEAKAEQERERTAAAEARAERLMDRYEAVTEALIRRLEGWNGDDAQG